MEEINGKLAFIKFLPTKRFKIPQSITFCAENKDIVLEKIRIWKQKWESKGLKIIKADLIPCTIDKVDTKWFRYTCSDLWNNKESILSEIN